MSIPEMFLAHCQDEETAKKCLETLEATARSKVQAERPGCKTDSMAQEFLVWFKLIQELPLSHSLKLAGCLIWLSENKS